MSDVTDIAFRHILAKYGKSRENKNKIVFWTEFVSADGLCDKLGRKKLSHILKYSERERPIVAQVFGANPENMKKACQYIASLGFDGIDINMGCPDKSVISQGAGSALIKTPQLARKIIKAAQAGIKTAGFHIPVSVKTRIGYNKNEIETWIPELLKEDIAALTIHLRTTKEQSLVPAHWELMKRVVELRNKINPNTLIIGNGDIKDLKDGEEKSLKHGCDGVMIGRGVFGNPWFFSSRSPLEFFVPEGPALSPERPKKGAGTKNSRGRSEQKTGTGFVKEKLGVLIEHTQIFDKELSKPKYKNFAVMKKHFKAYVNDFQGAKGLRIKLMEAKNAQEVEKTVNDFLSKV